MDGVFNVGVRNRRYFQSFNDLWLSLSGYLQPSHIQLLPFHADDSCVLYIFCLFYAFVAVLVSLLPYTTKSTVTKMSGIDKLGSARQPLSTKQKPVIQDYTITDAVLGLGINGKVVECLDKKTGMKYALKVICFLMISVIIDLVLCKQA